MTLETKISQAKAKLLVNYPYFGTVASRLKLVLNNDIQSSKSDGKTLEYNSDFFKELELSEMEFVFANGAMHASLAHELRQNNRSGWLWQLSTDYAINDMLVENGLDRPYQAHYSKRFCGLCAEEIYAELKDGILRDELEYDADDEDDVEKKDNNNQEEKQDEENKTQEREEISQDILLEEQLFEEFSKSVLEAEQKKGTLPHSLDRFFELDTCSTIDWRDILKSSIDRFHKDDYTLLPPNKKFLYLGLYLPSSISNRFKIVIAIDSSGSVDEELLNKFLSEITFIMNTIQNYQIDLLVCDDKIHSHTSLYNGDTLGCELKGFGGTDFNPVFDFIEEELNDTKLLLYFSDLEAKFPTKHPNYDVKWVSPKEVDVPFGEVIVMNS